MPVCRLQSPRRVTNFLTYSTSLAEIASTSPAAISHRTLCVRVVVCVCVCVRACARRFLNAEGHALAQGNKWSEGRNLQSTHTRTGEL
jgi:hypothetical protein